MYYLNAGMGYPWAGQTKLSELPDLIMDILTLSFISTFGATEPTGSANEMSYVYEIFT